MTTKKNKLHYMRRKAEDQNVIIVERLDTWVKIARNLRRTKTRKQNISRNMVQITRTVRTIIERRSNALTAGKQGTWNDIVDNQKVKSTRRKTVYWYKHSEEEGPEATAEVLVVNCQKSNQHEMVVLYQTQRQSM